MRLTISPTRPRRTFPARAKGKKPGRQPLDMKKVEAAIKLVEAKTSPSEAAKQLGLGRSAVYREMRRLGISEQG